MKSYEEYFKEELRKLCFPSMELSEFEVIYEQLSEQLEFMALRRVGKNVLMDYIRNNTHEGV